MKRGAIVVLAALALAAPARAEERQLDYDAPAACPSADAFWNLFATRATHARLSEWKLEVRVREAAGPRYAGTVEVRSRDGTVTTRTLDDVSCADLSTALAVVAAVIVEPEPAPVPAPEPASVPVPAPAPEPVAPPPPREPWQGRVGLAFAAATHLAPLVSFGGEGFVELGRDAGGVIAFWLRAVLAIGSSGPFDVGPAGAMLTSLFGRVEAGGLRLRLAPHLAFRLGGAVEAGGLLGAGRNVDGAEAHWAPWLAIGGVARGTWELGRLFVELGLVGIVPLTRPRFVAQPGPVVLFEVPPAGALGELGVGFRF